MTPLIKDLKNVKDEDITLLDVKRAEEIIERANKLLGRKTECHHWHGWNHLQTIVPHLAHITPFCNDKVWSVTTSDTVGLNVSLISAVNSL